jgi:hypothetical protein
MKCIYCGEAGLNWHGTNKGKRLGRDGVIHSCRQYRQQAFKKRHEQQLGHDHMKSNGLKFSKTDKGCLSSQP